MQLAPHYLTYTMYAGDVIGTGDPKTFSEACDDYGDFRDDGYVCIVFRCEPAKQSMVDVTADADALIRQRLNKRRQEFPEWLAA